MADDSGPSRAAGSDDDDAVKDAAAQWNDWREDAALGQAGEEESAQSLFSAAVLPSAAAAIAHDREQHAFDMAQFAAQRRLDEYGVIRCINFIRSEVAAGRDPRAQLASPAEPPPWAADQYLQPVLPDDALLMHDFGDEHPAPSGPVTQQGSTVTAFDELARLRAHNEALREALATSSGLPALQELREDGGAERDSMAVDMRSSTAAPPLRTAATAADTRKRVSFSAALAAEAGRVDDTYFDSYSYFDIHHEMLGDTARTEAYRDALEQNPRLLHGATVLDVGCGTGILSLFAARSGAARVIGVDGSERIAGFARQIAAKNALDASAGGPVSIVTGKVEELAALPGGMQADVLVSEWMGYALLFESMLDSVLHARDRFLKPGGAVLPDLATLHVAGGGARAGGLAFWDDVYGFDMSPVAAALQQAALRDAVVAPVRAEDLVTPSMPLRVFDLATMAPGDADFTADFRLQPEDGDRESVACHSVVLWFDVEFSTRFCAEHAVRLTTSPHAPQTHWAQVILSFREPILLHPPQPSGISHGIGGNSIDNGSAHAVAITGQISIARSSKHRALDISLTYRPVFADGHASAWEQTSFFEMGVSG